MAAAKQALRVVSYNVQRWANVEALIHTLTRLRPDILCLQECCQKRSPEALQKVADACGLESVHFFGHTLDGRYGNAILTKSTSTFVQEMFLAGGSVIRGHHIQRGALLVEVGSLRVCCTHLDHISEDERCIQAGGLVRQLHDLYGDAQAMVLAGDLNCLNDEADWGRLEALHAEKSWAPPFDSTLPGGALHAFLANGWADVSAGAGRSSPAADPVRRIDYVLAHGPVSVKGARVDPSAQASDHLPVVVELEVPC